MQALQFSARGISVCVDLSVGHIADLLVQSESSMLRPLHRAPWIDEPADRVPEGIAPGLARLSGDFLCAPFSLNDVEPAPGHGWPANSAWDIVSSQAIPGGWQAVLELRRRVFGASVTKILTLRDEHPFLYQEHRFSGGAGCIPVAHHVMSFMGGDGLLSFSPKRVAVTPEKALETDPARGDYLLAYPGRSEDLTRFPDRKGGVTDLTHYRAEDRREDFVVLVEAGHDGPGWTALSRTVERDLLLVLKNPRDLPVTMLWLSNGGRSYAPWNNRHVGVLGIEDGRTAVGHGASMNENFVSREGAATTFDLEANGEIVFRHVIGATQLGGEAKRVNSLLAEPGRLLVELADGSRLGLPYDDNFLA